MGDQFFVACNTVPEIDGTEVRFSIRTCDIVQIRNWPLRYITADTIVPPQCRLQWGVPVCGPRLDSYKALRLGDERYNLEIGMRSTNAGGSLKDVEEQRVGVATLTLGGQFKLSYWNDHKFWWWPMAGGTDQGDTAGMRFSFNLGNQGFPLIKGWQWQTLNLSLRLATGIPDKKSVREENGRTFYSNVTFSGIDHGDIDLNSTLTKGDTQRLTVGVFVNSGAIRDATQNKLVHNNLSIPEVPATGRVDAMIYLKLEGW
jgi:hypothetical protein